MIKKYRAVFLLWHENIIDSSSNPLRVKPQHTFLTPDIHMENTVT